MGINARKIQEFEDKAGLPSLLCYLMCTGYFGGDFLIFFRFGTL